MSLIRRHNIFDPFSFDPWDPFEGFPFNAVSVPRSNAISETSSFANARIDWKETPEAHVFKADLPGVRKKEVKVEVEDGRVLQISGERSREHEEKNDKWHRVERSSGKFMRRFRLPENAKTDHIKASMDNGVLTVTVPKDEVKKPEMKSIDISGGDAGATAITNGSAQGEGREQAAAAPSSHGVGEGANQASGAPMEHEKVAQETH